MPSDAKSSRNRPRLGRGLSSLIGSSLEVPVDEGHYEGQNPPPHGEDAATEASGASQPRQPVQASEAAGPIEIPPGDIAANPYQPRRAFSERELAELADSIRQQGIIQPLVVARAGEDADKPFVLVAGERRLRAAKTAGLQAVPCVVRKAAPQQMLEWALIENIHRSDLNPIERAAAYREYMDRFQLTQAEAAERLGQSRSAVANHLRMLDLHEDVQKMVAGGQLSFGHAKVLAALTDRPGRQAAVARKVVEWDLSVRQTEGLVGAATADATPGETRAGGKPSSKPSYVRDLEDRLTRAVGTRVSIKTGRAKNTGRVVIDYYSLADFDRIAQMLGLDGEM